MRMAHDFGTARLAAQHCAELVARGPRPEEREALIGSWRRALARALGESLGALLAGDRLHCEVTGPEWLMGSEALNRIGPVAANCLLRCGAARSAGAGAGAAHGTGTDVLLSLDHATVLALAERSFGGEGRVGEPMLDPLPRSAQLLCGEVAALVASAIAQACLGEAAGAGEVIIRSENAARLRALDPARQAALFTIRLADARGCDWHMMVALAANRLDDLLPAQGAARASGAARPVGHPAAAFGGIPLPLRAVLAEFDLTLGQLDRLAPGDTFPIPMPRHVPLRAGEALVALGSIGTLDERLALCLTQVPHEAPGAAPTQGIAR
ncbi:MAG: FliM/FliN family flagellar motor C-terminal domain-containing protein [Erythrobacter sp.]